MANICEIVWFIHWSDARLAQSSQGVEEILVQRSPPFPTVGEGAFFCSTLAVLLGTLFQIVPWSSWMITSNLLAAIMCWRCVQLLRSVREESLLLCRGLAIQLTRRFVLGGEQSVFLECHKVGPISEPRAMPADIFLRLYTWGSQGGGRHHQQGDHLLLRANVPGIHHSGGLGSSLSVPLGPLVAWHTLLGRMQSGFPNSWRSCGLTYRFSVAAWLIVSSEWR